MSTIPKLNLHGSDEHTQALNRWADSVTTAFADQLSKVHATNQQAVTADAVATNLGNTPVVAPNPTTGIMQQGSLNKLPVAPRPITPITLDYLSDGTTYNRLLAAHMYQGGILPAHINGQLASIDIGIITQITTIGGSNATNGWQVRATSSIDLPAGVNSITFTLGGAALVTSGTGSFALGTNTNQGWGVAIYSGSAPTSPSANSNGVITQNSMVTILSPAPGIMNIAFYTFWAVGSSLGLLSNGAFFGIHTVLPCAASSIT